MIVLDAPHLLDTLVTFMLISVRISAMLITAPLFSAAAITVPVRIVTALSISILMLEAIYPPVIDILSPRGILAIAGEAVIGLIIGFMFQLAFAAVAMAGEQISSSMGLGFAAMVDPQSGTQSPVVTQFMTVTMLIVFMTIEGPHVLFKQLAASFVAMPIGEAFLRPDMVQSLLRSAGILFSAALLISLPIVLALFLVTLLVGVLTRVAPQLNLFSVGFSISIIAGLLLLLIAFPGMTRSMSGLLDEFAQKAQLMLLPTAGG